MAGINQVLRSMCGIASPAIGTLAITYMSIHSVLYLDILGALAAILSLVFVFIPHYSTATTSLSAKHVVSDLKKGLDCVLANRGIALLFLCAMSVTFCIIPSSFMFPLLTTQCYHGGKWKISTIEIGWSVGMLLGGTALAFFKPKTRKIVLVNAMYVSLGTAFFSVASCRPTVLWVMYRLSYSQVSHCRYSQPRLSLSCKRKSHPIYRDVYSLCIIVLPFCLR